MEKGPEGLYFTVWCPAKPRVANNSQSPQKCWPSFCRSQGMHVQHNCVGRDLSNLTSSPAFTPQHLLLVIGADFCLQQFLTQAMQLKILTPTVLGEHRTALGTKHFPRTSPSRWHKFSELWMGKGIPRRCSDSTDTAGKIFFLYPHNPSPYSSQLFST